MEELSQSFVLYTNYSGILTMLSDEDLGKIFRAILIYKKEKEVIELPNQLAVVFALLKNQLDHEDN